MDKTPEGDTKKRYKGEGRVGFLAHLASIRNDIEAGWPLAAVYDRHKDKLQIQYQQFYRYVGKYIREQPVAKSKATPVAKTLPPIAKPEPKALNDATPLSDSELF